MLLALSAAAGAEEAPVLASFRWGDIQAMNRAAQAFQGEDGVANGQGQVEFFVLRGRSLDALSPDLQPALEGQRAVCIGQYRSGGVPHRVLYSVDNPPLLLGIFRQEAGGRWTECTGGVPLPDAAGETDKPADSLPPLSRNYAHAAEFGERTAKHGDKESSGAWGNTALQIFANTVLWPAVFR